MFVLLKAMGVTDRLWRVLLARIGGRPPFGRPGSVAFLETQGPNTTVGIRLGDSKGVDLETEVQDAAARRQKALAEVANFPTVGKQVRQSVTDWRETVLKPHRVDLFRDLFSAKTDARVVGNVRESSNAGKREN